jgi:2-hydroxychromene-2-carboxylate isomerase
MNGQLYFDVISPFAYLMLEQIDRLPKDLNIEYRPILLAGLLDHFNHKGPAEIPSKRIFTYRKVLLDADNLGVPLRFPPAHPFNPLSLLRLALLVGNDLDRIRTITRRVWVDGVIPETEAELDDLGAAVGVAEASQAIRHDEVKRQLRQNSQYALENGVFGVPTMVIDGQLFWGADSIDMLTAFLADPDLFQRGEMARISNLPVGIMRKTN